MWLHKFFIDLPPLVFYAWRLEASPYNTSFVWVLASALVAAVVSREPSLLAVLGVNLAVSAVIAFLDHLRTRALGRAVVTARELQFAGAGASPSAFRKVNVPAIAFHRPLAIVLGCVRVAVLAIQLYAFTATEHDILRALLFCGMLTSLANAWTEVAWIHAASTVGATTDFMERVVGNQQQLSPVLIEYALGGERKIDVDGGQQLVFGD